jgi:hypothetical protein
MLVAGGNCTPTRSLEMAPLSAESTQAFISRHNIERYEHLLETTTDQVERQRILKLLTEERQKQQDAGDKPNR